MTTRTPYHNQRIDAERFAAWVQSEIDCAHQVSRSLFTHRETRRTVNDKLEQLYDIQRMIDRFLVGENNQ